MPNSLRSKLSKLRYKRRISDEEYRELLNKLRGHDKELLDKIRAEIEQEIIPRNSDKYDYETKWQNLGLRMALKIINKYKSESEVQE